MWKAIVILVCIFSFPFVSGEQGSSVAHITFLSGHRFQGNSSSWNTGIRPILAKQQNVSHQLVHTDLLIWLGNTIDIGSHNRSSVVDAARVALSAPDSDNHYQSFVNDVVQKGGGFVDGVWDIQDVGGAKFHEEDSEHKSHMKEDFVNFLGKEISHRTDIWNHSGLYHFLTLKSPPSSPLYQVFENSVCVITLDILSFRTPLPNLHDTILRWKSPEPPNYARSHEKNHAANSIYDDDLLGDDQWKWLEEILTTYVSVDVKGLDGRQKCAVTVIVTPWQLLLNDNKPFYGWDLYPASRSRLLDLLQQTRASRFVFLSGHASTGEFGRIRRASQENVMPQGFLRLYAEKIPVVPATKRAAALLPNQKPLIEVTSSGITQSPSDSRLWGFLYRSVVQPVINEAEIPLSFYPRYISLERHVLPCRNFGTLRIVQQKKNLQNESNWLKIMQSFSLEVTLHPLNSANADNTDGCEDVLISHSLDDLPSYDTEFSQRDLEFVPLFSVYSVPKEYPELKKTLLAANCPEFECSERFFYMLTSMVTFRHIIFLMSLLVVLLISTRFCALASKNRMRIKKKQ